MGRLASFGAEIQKDEVGNILGIIKPLSSSGHSTIMLQAHMDMVVAGDISPAEARVNVIEEKGFLKSDGHTTLGADNGVGVAIILALMEEFSKGDKEIRVLFTVSEEVGLKGAKEIPEEWLKNVDYFINLDGFHSDTAVIGCKGGLRETFSRDIKLHKLLNKSSSHTRKKNALKEIELYEVKLEGYLGGHSGDDIDKGRLNTICQLAGILQDVQDEFDMGILTIEGGAGYNVIPGECRAVVAIPRACRLSAGKLIVKDEHVIEEEYEKSDPTGTIKVKWLGEADSDKEIWDYTFQREVLYFLCNIENGIEALDEEGTVTSSCNLGIIHSRHGKLIIGDMLRCDDTTQEDELLKIHQGIAEETGFDVEVVGYHSWSSRPKNNLVDAVDKAYQELHGFPIKRERAKVGLEPAYFHPKNPKMEIVCLGADIFDAHSTHERVSLSSIKGLYELTLKTIGLL